MKTTSWLWRVPTPTSPLLCVRTTVCTSIFFHERTWTSNPPQPGAYKLAEMQGGLVFLVGSRAEYRATCESPYFNSMEDCVVVRLANANQCSFCLDSDALRCDVIGCKHRVCARCTSLSPGYHPDANMMRVCPHHVHEHQCGAELRFYFPYPMYVH